MCERWLDSELENKIYKAYYLDICGNLHYSDPTVSQSWMWMLLFFEIPADTFRSEI